MNERVILVTGGAGYLGSQLCKRLLSIGARVRCLDIRRPNTTLFDEMISNRKFDMLQEDIREASWSDRIFAGVGTAIHLANLSSVACCNVAEDLSREINCEATVRLAKKAKKNGVKQLIFSSSCNIYSESSGNLVAEDTFTNPKPDNLYSYYKLASEQQILPLTNNGFRVISLRLSTLFGLTPDVRFDLLLNKMVKDAVFEGRIVIVGDPGRFRPLLSVEDATAILTMIAKQEEAIIPSGVYNVGRTSNILTLRQAAEMVNSFIPSTKIIVHDSDDNSSYRPDFSKLEKELGWTPNVSVEQGVAEMVKLLQKDPEKWKLYFSDARLEFVKEKQAMLGLKGGFKIADRRIQFAAPSISKKEKKAAARVLQSGWLTAGSEVRALEEDLKDFLGREHILAVSSCTAALHLALLAVGVGSGDEVITSPITWASTVNVIAQTGARIVFADIDSATLNISPDEIRRKITPRTKVIIPVHIAGRPCEMREIMKIGREHNMIIIEDAAHAFGSEYEGKRIGCHGDIVCFSFYGTKNITTIEGGAIATWNSRWAEAMRTYSNCGMSNSAWNSLGEHSRGVREHVSLGFKYNLEDVGAAIGRVQLSRFQVLFEKRERLWRFYHANLRGLPLEHPPMAGDNQRICWHLYIVKLCLETLCASRDEIAVALKGENIETGVHFRALHLQPFCCKEAAVSDNDLPQASAVSKRILSLPFHPGMRRSDVWKVAKALKKVCLAFQKK